MSDPEAGLGLLTILTWALLLIAGRRNGVIRPKLAESALVDNEFVRLLADSHAAAKAMLGASPESAVTGLCAEQRRRLCLATAAVDEFRL